MSMDTDVADSDQSSAPTSPFAAELPIIEISEAALTTVEAIRAEQQQPDEVLALRIEITGVRGPEFVYDLSLDDIAHASDADVVVDCGAISVVVPQASVDRLRGSVLDVPRASGQGGLVIRNPNRPDPLEGVEVNLEGSIAEKVQQLLEQSINPSLASHGGFATLVGVDEGDKVYITMGGGCQGCSMSRLTLTEGIQKSIMESIPEVVEVVDATDHAAGENPFL